MADVGEERNLRTVDLGQRFRFLALFFVGTSVGKRRADRSRNQVVEAAIRLVHRQTRTDASDHHCRRLFPPGLGDGQCKSHLRDFRIWANSHAGEKPRGVGNLLRLACARDLAYWPGPIAWSAYIHEFRAHGSSGPEASLADQPRLPPVPIQQIEEDKGEIQVSFCENLRANGKYVLGGPGSARMAGQVAQRLGAPLGQHLTRHLGDWMEQAPDAAGLVGDWTEGESKPGFFEETVAVQEHAHLFQIRALARPCPGVSLADHRERGGPAFAKVLAHRRWMFGAADGPIAVVVDLDVARAPSQGDRRVGGLDKADRRAQTLWPGRHGPKWSLRPIHGFDHLGHLAAADEPVFQTGVVPSDRSAVLRDSHAPTFVSDRGPVAALQLQ